MVVKEDWQHAQEFCEKMQAAVRTAVSSVQAELLTELRAAKSPVALHKALRNLAARNGDVITRNILVENEAVVPMKVVARYIYDEMIKKH